MTQEQIKELGVIVDTYGPDKQIDMAIEEQSELIKALLKYRRKFNGDTTTGEEMQELREDIVDELADVKIMEQQLEIIFGCSDEVEKRIEFKIARQNKRMRERTVKENVG